ncbi:PREDICTED: unnamed product [Prunus dulcis]|nr:PREDICTED: unnamed product [Prunus dulcis]
MGSRCHSLTLGKLYAWEKKLYEEVKAGEETMRIYERKHSQSRHGLKTGDKIGVEVEELRSRILVAITNSE